MSGEEWKQRASRVLPNGMYGHLSVGGLPGFPQFYTRGSGCRVVDVAGTEYIDFMCSYGPNVLGHHCPAVEAAAQEQAARGDTLVGPCPVMVELAEELVKDLPGMQWAMFGKNGNDVTTLAVTVARAQTGRPRVAAEPSAYHGSSPDWSQGRPGVVPSQHAEHVPFTFNDLSSVEAALRTGDVAAMMVSAFDYRWSRDMELPTPEFARGVRALCTKYGTLMILDDVRAGFRLDARGSWAPYGVVPDMMCFSKAIANGYSLSALVGGEQAREGASNVFATGSFWCGAVSMAAALATLRLIKSKDAVGHMDRVGRLFQEGLRTQAARHGLEVLVSGPPAMPFMSFVADTEEIDRLARRPARPRRPRAMAFCQETVRRGVYLHPHHNWFICAAHTDEDIKAALRVTDVAFAEVAKLYNTPRL